MVKHPSARAKHDQQTETAATVAGTAPRFVRAQVVAEILDVSPRCVALWAQNGKIPCVRIGGTLRFNLAAVMATLAEAAAVRDAR